MPHFSRPGTDLWYEKFGPREGIPVIGIMGLGAHGGYWSPDFINDISKKSGFLIFDNRGVARSTGDFKNLSMSIMADDISALMDHLEIPNAHVVGVSMGGMIALTFALRFPQRLRSLTLACTTARPKKFNFNLEMFSPLLQSLRQGGKITPLLLSASFMEKNPQKTKEFEGRIRQFKVSKQVFLEQLKACIEFDVSERISEISTPTLVMTGDKDIIIPFKSSQELSDNIPNSTLHIFPGSGHAFILENHKEVIAELSAHWQKNS
jgi:3-oxoadipate enol-lactonase